jgi:ceramide glucosyltransferase
MKYSLICPLCEYTDLLSLTLESLFHMACADYEIIFAAEPSARLAIHVATALCRRYPAIPAKVIVMSTNYCVNPKLNNVQKGWLAASGEWVLMIDCNILAPADAIQRLEARWSPTVGMVCSPPVGTQPANFWAEVECCFLNSFEAKWQMLADRMGYGFVQGKVMFCQKQQFDRLGGLPALDLESCEDAAATKLIRRAGLQARLVKTLFHQPLGARSFGRVWQRQLRWAKLRRTTFPLWFALELLCTPVPLMAALLDLPPVWPVGVFLAFYLIEIGFAKWQGWHLSWRTPLAMLVRDVMLIGLWIAGWFGDDILWAGQRLALHRPDDAEEAMPT